MMLKKIIIILLGLIMLTTLTACPDQDKSNQQEESKEQIPNTMQKTTNELEQIITLLGGPLFDERDSFEQIKNDQLQKLSELSKKSSLGTENEEKSQENQKDAQGQKGSQGGKQEEGQGGKQEEEQGEGQEEEQGEQKKDEGSGDEEQSKESESSDKEGGGEKSDKGGSEEDVQKENSGEKQDTQRPSKDDDEQTFQYDDSLFGMPQWKEDNWKMIKVLTDGMHFTWNNLQPDLLEKGVSQTQIGNFGKALELLSQNASSKNIEGAQNAVFQLSQSLSDFYSYYKTEIPPELQRISSAVTGIHFSVRQGNWKQGQELANQLQQELTKLKSSIEDNQSQIFQMLELSINDLCSTVQNQDTVLAMVRTNLVVANIHELNVKLSQKRN